MNQTAQVIAYCVMCACLAITYRRYLIQDGGLLSWVPGLFYKAMPINYDNWNGLQKAVEKILITCATCQAGQIAFWGQIAHGKPIFHCLLCAGLASVIAHVVDQKYFA